MKEVSQPGLTTGETVTIKCSNPFLIEELSGGDFESSNEKWHIAHAFPGAARNARDFPKLPEEAAADDRQLHISHRLPKSLTGTLYRDAMALSFVEYRMALRLFSGYASGLRDMTVQRLVTAVAFRATGLQASNGLGELGIGLSL